MSKSWESIKAEAMKKAAYNEEVYHGCGQSTLLALQEALGMENEELFRAATAVCGGVAFEGKYCGALVCGIMVLGTKYGRSDIKKGFPDIVKGVIPANRLTERYRKEFGSVVCLDVMKKFATSGQVAFGQATPNQTMLKYMIDHPEVVEKRMKELDMQCAKVTGFVAGAVVDILEELEKEGYKV
jgi:C_GCAxxG_C_C family probable redox protein